MLTQEQAEAIKQRLIEQIEATFPEDRKEFARNQIEAMSLDELEKFLIKNNLIKTTVPSGKENCVFCAIVSGDIKSYKIAENKKALAVLEINPLTRGHAIIIPKEHSNSEEPRKEVVNIIKKVSAMVKRGLKPKEIREEQTNIMGHEIINIIPVYEGAGSKERKHATSEELSELQETLKKKVQRQTREKKARKTKETGIKKIIKEFEEKIWLPKRIP